MTVPSNTSLVTEVQRQAVDATQTLEQWFERADESLPVLTHSARWVVFALGVVLWLAGGKLVKAACIFGGLILGMIVGGLSLAFVESALVVVGFMVGLGLLGALGAWFMFRAWVAMAAALVFAIAAPAAVLVWQDVPPQQLSDDTAQATVQVEKRYNAGVSQLNDTTRIEVQQLIDQGDTASLEQANTILEEQGTKTYEAAREILFRNLEDVDAWWRSKDAEAVRLIGLAMLIGGGIGFLLGFIMPNYAASIQCAMVGSVLIVIPGRELLVTYFTEASAWTPATARGTLASIGLITVTGMIVQWMLYLRDDKQTK